MARKEDHYTSFYGVYIYLSLHSDWRLGITKTTAAMIGDSGAKR